MPNESTNANGESPDPTRLQAAIDLIVSRVEPDQIILFGSAARDEMCTSSDLDLLVIIRQQAKTRLPEHEHWKCQATGDELDVILMDRATAERGRRSAAYIQGAALEEGRTIYAREGTEPVRTGRDYTPHEREMVKSTLYEPDHASVFVEQAARKWRSANREEHPVDKCEMLQASMERALKALITAQGRRVQHKHNLNALWDQAEADGEKIQAVREPEELRKLTKYAGEWQYAIDHGTDPGATWSTTRNTAERLLTHARERVPQLIQQTQTRLQQAANQTRPQERDAEPAPHAEEPRSMPVIAPGRTRRATGAKCSRCRHRHCSCGGGRPTTTERTLQRTVRRTRGLNPTD